MAVIRLPNGSVWGSSRAVLAHLLETVADSAGEGSLREKLLNVEIGYSHFDMSELTPDEVRQFASRLDEIVKREAASGDENEHAQAVTRKLVDLSHELSKIT